MRINKIWVDDFKGLKNKEIVFNDSLYMLRGKRKTTIIKAIELLQKMVSLRGTTRDEFINLMNSYGVYDTPITFYIEFLDDDLKIDYRIQFNQYGINYESLGDLYEFEFKKIKVNSKIATNFYTEKVIQERYKVECGDCTANRYYSTVLNFIYGSLNGLNREINNIASYILSWKFYYSNSLHLFELAPYEFQNLLLDEKGVCSVMYDICKSYSSQVLYFIKHHIGENKEDEFWRWMNKELIEFTYWKVEKNKLLDVIYVYSKDLTLTFDEVSSNIRQLIIMLMYVYVATENKENCLLCIDDVDMLTDKKLYNKFKEYIKSYSTDYQFLLSTHKN